MISLHFSHNTCWPFKCSLCNAFVFMNVIQLKISKFHSIKLRGFYLCNIFAKNLEFAAKALYQTECSK